MIRPGGLESNSAIVHRTRGCLAQVDQQADLDPADPWVAAHVVVIIMRGIDQLLELGSWHAAKEAGKLRLEGKDYVAHDGDVMEFRFNV